MTITHGLRGAADLDLHSPAETIANAIDDCQLFALIGWTCQFDLRHGMSIETRCLYSRYWSPNISIRSRSSK